MRLTLRLAATIFAGLCLVLATNFVVGVQLEKEARTRDAARDQKVLATATAKAVNSIWQAYGKSRALQLIDEANAEAPTVLMRWVLPNAPAGSPDKPRVHVTEAMLSTAKRVITIGSDNAGTEIMSSYSAIEPGTLTRGAIEIREDVSAQGQFASSFLTVNVIGSVVMAAVGILLSLFFGRRWVAVPVRNLVETTRRVAEGDLSAQSLVTGSDEIARLSHAMNEMINHLGRAMEQLRHADRMSTIGELSSGVAHELGTPLHVALGRAKAIIADAECTENLRNNAEIVVKQVGKMNHIIRQLLTFAHAKNLKKRTTNILGIVNESVAMMLPMARKKQVDIVLTESTDRSIVEVDPTQIQQVFTNLLSNALHASPPKTKIEVRLETATRPAYGNGRKQTRGGVLCSIEDEGDGIDEENLSRIFEPFFTTKDVGEGTGLGLSIAQGIVREHGGQIQATSTKGTGSCFSVFLPEV